jgi:type II secretory pathway pseudopilin PulG
VSLVELLVVIAVMGVAAGALSRVAVHQQRRYRELSVTVQARTQLRHGAELLANEFRGLSAVGGDIYPGEMHDASIAVRATIGSYLLCGRPSAGAVDVDVTSLDPGGSLDGAPAPSPGDSAFLYDTGVAGGPSDDSWRAHLITAVTSVAVHCAPANDSNLADESTSSVSPRRTYRLSVHPSPTSSLDPHAPVRLFRRVRYALYQSSDGEWYLGYSDCRPIVRAPPCATIQPVSGPYLPYAAPGSSKSSGLTFSYFDAEGLETTDPLLVARIEVTLRARAPVGAQEVASMDISAALRNRR